MKISIVVSSYNGAEYVLEQLESIKMQKLQADEVLIFDDGSKDDTVSMVQGYIAPERENYAKRSE